MAKINNTSTFPIVPADEVADGDLLIGTDVSDTTNDAAGETKNFKIEDIRGSWKLIEGGNLTTGSAANDFENWADDSVYFAYKFTATASHDDASTRSISLNTSTDGGSTYNFLVDSNTPTGGTVTFEATIYNGPDQSRTEGTCTVSQFTNDTGIRVASAPVDGLRVSVNSGNINGGTYAIYGLRRP